MPPTEDPEIAINASFTLPQSAADELERWVTAHGGRVDMIHQHPTSTALRYLGLPPLAVTRLAANNVDSRAQLEDLDEVQLRRLRGIGWPLYRQIVSALAGRSEPILLRNSPPVGDLIELLPIDDKLYLHLRLRRQRPGAANRRIAFQSISEITEIDSIGLMQVIGYENAVLLRKVLADNGHVMSPHREDRQVHHLLDESPSLLNLFGQGGLEPTMLITDLTDEFILDLDEKLLGLKGADQWRVMELVFRLDGLGFITEKNKHQLFSIISERHRRLRELALAAAAVGQL